jgi:hypothetical protein
MTAAEITVEVKTPDLRNALTAVAPHAEKHATGDNSVEHRVRILLRDSEALVMATNGNTSAVARLPYAETAPIDLAAEPWTIDITPRHVKLALQQFKPTSGNGEDMNEVIRLTATPSELTLTDAGGLFTGEHQGWPTLPVASDYPDLYGILGQALAQAGADPIGKPLVADGRLISLFTAASVAYGAPLDFRASGPKESRGYVVECGPWFRGLVSSRHDDDHWRRQRDASHRTWLGILGVAAPAEPELVNA